MGKRRKQWETRMKIRKEGTRGDKSGPSRPPLGMEGQHVFSLALPPRGKQEIRKGGARRQGARMAQNEWANEYSVVRRRGELRERLGKKRVLRRSAWDKRCERLKREGAKETYPQRAGIVCIVNKTEKRTKMCTITCHVIDSHRPLAAFRPNYQAFSTEQKGIDRVQQ